MWTGDSGTVGKCSLVQILPGGIVLLSLGKRAPSSRERYSVVRIVYTLMRLYGKTAHIPITPTARPHKTGLYFIYFFAIFRIKLFNTFSFKALRKNVYLCQRSYGFGIVCPSVSDFTLKLVNCFGLNLGNVRNDTIPIRFRE